MVNTELQFEMAMRDQVIHNQRKALKDLWNLLVGLGLDDKEVAELAAKQGLMIEDWMTSSLHLSCQKLSPNLACGIYPPLRSCPCKGQYTRSSCINQHNEDLSSKLLCRKDCDSLVSSCQEHRSSYYLVSHGEPPGLELKKSVEHSIHHSSGSWLGTHDMNPQDMRHSCPDMRSHPHHGESCIPVSSLGVDFDKQCKVCILQHL